MGNTDRAWKLWGKTNPYYGVIPHEKFNPASIAENKAEFFDSGERYISDTLDEFSRIYGPMHRGTALDFGCGVGRLVMPLAARFESVTGVDISPGMLATAAQNCSDRGIANASFVLSDDALSRVTGQYDLVHSYIVLQHIPTRRGMKIIDRLLGSVTNGGAAILHISIKRKFPLFYGLVYFAKNHIPFARYLINLLRGFPINRPTMEMNEYPLADVLSDFSRNGFGPLHVQMEDHMGVLTCTIMGRKTS